MRPTLAFLLLLAGCAGPGVPVRVHASEDPPSAFELALEESARPYQYCDGGVSRSETSAALREQPQLPLDPAPLSATQLGDLNEWVAVATTQHAVLDSDLGEGLMAELDAAMDGRASRSSGGRWMDMLWQSANISENTFCFPAPPGSLPEGLRAYLSQAERFKIRAINSWRAYLQTAGAFLASPSGPLDARARDQQTAFLIESERIRRLIDEVKTAYPAP